MAGDGIEPGGDDLSARLKRLESQLERTRHASGPAKGTQTGSSGGVSPLGQAMRLSSEFIGGVVVGGALGWGLDWLAGTRPWGLIVFLVLGFASGIYNVMRSSGFIAKPSRKNGQDTN